jgi:hypothetical protein
MIRLAIRGYVNGEREFEEKLEIFEENLDVAIADAGTRHAEAMARHDLHMIEIEFLDEPNPAARFFRFGTDPRAMGLLMLVDLNEG